MISRLRALAGRAIDAVASVRIVPIDRCYHYRGYRYGGFGNNPYEDYILGLARGLELADLRAEFASRVLNCRPRTMATALQIDVVGLALWEYPWDRRATNPRKEVDEPTDNPDVMCHFCPKGILASHINREFGWLESAWESISSSGYQPQQFSYVRCIELLTKSRSSYLVLDGNHRISAMHAAGLTGVEAKILRLHQVRREAAPAWPRVRDQTIALDQALRVFDRYFAPHNPALITQNPATLLLDEPPQWAPCEVAAAPTPSTVTTRFELSS